MDTDEKTPRIGIDRSSIIAWVAAAAILAAAIPITVAMMGGPGDLSSYARYYQTGQPLSVDSAEKNFGAMKLGEVTEVGFRFFNASSEPLRILGGRVDCGCLLIEDLPLVIEGRSEKSLQVKVSPPEPGDYTGRIALYTSVTGDHPFDLKILGRVDADPATTDGE